MANAAVIGVQWGDEGKGKIIDFLTSGANYVVRYHGGNNAGHTIVIDDVPYILHTLPSGIIHSEKTCVISNGMVVDPWKLIEELDTISKSVPKLADLVISDKAHLVLPWHIAEDIAREGTSSRIGTTNRGIGPAYADKAYRRGILVCSLIGDSASLRSKLEKIAFEKNNLLGTRFDARQIYDDLMHATERLANHIGRTEELLHHAISAGASILFEGAQGFMLDINHGNYPWVTSSDTTIGGIYTGTGVRPRNINVVGVAKAYTTKVGDGPFPTELDDAVGNWLRKKGGEFGATTGRPRRCGWFDAVVAREAIRASGIDSIALTKLDILSDVGSAPDSPVPLICVEYKDASGRTVDHIPADAEEYQRFTPVFEIADPWTEDISGAKEWNDLPRAAQSYVLRLESLLGVPIQYIGVGRNRKQLIVR